MGYLRHGVSWVDSSLVHLEGLLQSHSLPGLPVLLVLLLVALFAKYEEEQLLTLPCSETEITNMMPEKSAKLRAENRSTLQ
jgi:hypothetical protein